MEDRGEKEALCKEPKFLGKAGWLKKAPGRLLASYKDRYMLVEKTEVVVYENDDMQNCLERLDLENYEKCHELKSPFKRKHRLILIRAPKAGNKVSDFKFQAQTAEERDSWIKALSDCICRAKNKILDEVKIDESCNLEHVTRTRPKGNRNRRPPTRIHMKEVADVSSDGIRRLDLDLEDAFMPNGMHHESVDAVKEVQMPPSSISEAVVKPPGPDAENERSKEVAEEQKETILTEPEVTQQKKAIKPPMPPTKEAKPSTASGSELEMDDVPEKIILKPPMTPSKEAKPVKAQAEAGMSEKGPDVSKKTAPPPKPPKKCGSVSNLAEDSQPPPHPPTPPCKEKKPPHLSTEPNHKVQVQGTANDSKEKEKDEKKEATDQPSSEKTSHSVREDEADCANTEGQYSEKESKKGTSCCINAASKSELILDALGNSPSPLLTSENQLEEPAPLDMQETEGKITITQPQVGQDLATLHQKAPNTSISFSEEQEVSPESDIPPIVVALEDPISIGLLPREKKNRAEEKSVDSGQHSDDGSEGSDCEDTLATSTAALRGSNPGVDVLDNNEDIVQISVSVKPTQTASKPQVPAKIFPRRLLDSNLPLKPTAKARSASIGDLLSESSAQLQVTQPLRAVSANYQSAGVDVRKLEAEVALEMETTSDLLNRVSSSQVGGDGQDRSEDLLAKAMEKLKKADHVLREVQKLTPPKNTSNRKSW